MATTAPEPDQAIVNLSRAWRSANDEWTDTIAGALTLELHHSLEGSMA